jgi:hypothetical protein
MHLVISTQSKDSVYDKLANVTPMVPSTGFMARAVQQAAKDKLLKTDNKKQPIKETNEVLYQLKQPNEVKNMTCFSCGKAGHYAKDCRTKARCLYCKLTGHSTVQCKKRMSDKVTYCNKCQRYGHESKSCQTKYCAKCNKYGHDISNCRRNNNGNNDTRFVKNTRPSRVNAVNESEMYADPDQSYDTSDQE